MIIVEVNGGISNVTYNSNNEECLGVDWDDVADDFSYALGIWQDWPWYDLPKKEEVRIKSTIFEIWEYDDKKAFFLAEFDFADVEEWARSEGYLYCDDPDCNETGDGSCGWVDHEDEPVDIEDLLDEAVAEWNYPSE